VNPYSELIPIINSAADYVSYALAEAKRLAPNDHTLEDKIYDAFMHLRDAAADAGLNEQAWDTLSLGDK
jgi:hypothetical protein